MLDYTVAIGTHLNLILTLFDNKDGNGNTSHTKVAHEMRIIAENLSEYVVDLE